MQLNKEEENEPCDCEVKAIDLMSCADQVMSHWQVSQAFMRMAKRTKSKHVRAAFMEAEQRIIENLFESISQNELVEKKKSQDPIPEFSNLPHELSKLALCFPRTLLSMFMFKKSWNIQIFCDRCKRFVKLSELSVFDVCSKHHESVALHCQPSIEEILHQGMVDPAGVIEIYRKCSILRSEDDRGGDIARSEFLFSRTMYSEAVHNMPTIQELVQCKDIMLGESIEGKNSSERLLRDLEGGE